MASTAAAQVAMEMLFKQLLSVFTDQLEFFAQFKVMGLKVATTQVATAAKAQINAAQNIDKAEMSALALLESTKQQMKVFQDYSPQTGQGVNPCAQLEAQKAAVAATGFVVAQSAQLMGSVKAAAGRFGDSQTYASQMLKARFSQFATPDEEKLGYGKAAGEIVNEAGERINLAAADSNASTLFATSNDPRVAQAKQGYLNYLAGSPDAAITKQLATTGAGSQLLDTKNRKDAALSVGLNSIARVSAEYSPNEDVGGKSKMQVLKELTGTYFGQTATAMWQGWASQSERGLQVDAIKMSAATLSIEVDQLEQSQRLETLLGTLLALEAQGLKPEVDAKVRGLIDATLKSPVQ